MNKIDDDEEEKYIKLSNNDVAILKKITPDDRYSELKKVKEIDNIIKDLKIYNDKIGEKCSKFFNKIAEEKEFKKSKLIENCKEIKDAINKKDKEEKKKLKSQKPIKGKAGKSQSVKKTDIKDKKDDPLIPKWFYDLLKTFGVPITIPAVTALIKQLWNKYRSGEWTLDMLKDWLRKNKRRFIDRGGNGGDDDSGGGGGGGGGNSLYNYLRNKKKEKADLNIKANTEDLEAMVSTNTMQDMGAPSQNTTEQDNSSSLLSNLGLGVAGIGTFIASSSGVNWMQDMFNQPQPAVDPTLQMPDLSVPEMPEVPEGEPQQRIDEGRADLLDEEAVEEDMGDAPSQDEANQQDQARLDEMNRQIDDMGRHGNAWGMLFSGLSSGSNKLAESTHLLSNLLTAGAAIQEEQHIDQPLINIMGLSEEEITQRRNFQDTMNALEDEPKKELLDEETTEDVLMETMRDMITEDLIEAQVDLQNEEEVDVFLSQLISNVDEDVEYKEILTENINKIVNELVEEIVEKDKSKKEQVGLFPPKSISDEKDLTDEEKKMLKEEEKLIQEETLKIMKKISPDVNEDQITGMIDGMMAAILENNKDITDEELDSIMDSVMDKILEDTKKSKKSLPDKDADDIDLDAGPVSPPPSDSPPSSPMRQYRQRTLLPTPQEEASMMFSSLTRPVTRSRVPYDIMTNLSGAVTRSQALQDIRLLLEELKQIREKYLTTETLNEEAENELNELSNDIANLSDELLEIERLFSGQSGELVHRGGALTREGKNELKRRLNQYYELRKRFLN